MLAVFPYPLIPPPFFQNQQSSHYPQCRDFALILSGTLVPLLGRAVITASQAWAVCRHIEAVGSLRVFRGNKAFS